MAANVRQVFGLWMIAFGLVGSQMAWVLRPFISDPQRTEFVLIAQRESNFFAAVVSTLFARARNELISFTAERVGPEVKTFSTEVVSVVSPSGEFYGEILNLKLRLTAILQTTSC